ncbi:NADPH-dependent 7-cyano-7-deazaguanine reductase QueF [Aliikangiella maris]|uniref:NADPH-dependent 7-cyano-7-deazaguanine reductase n=2 Tax=Aliikangiella maris TaxID=3162458 RepID=A0ABV3MKP8_9GAMM
MSSEIPLGKFTDYQSPYSKELLYAIERSPKRMELPHGEMPYIKGEIWGEDIWNAYEISWLNPQGLPQVAVAEFRFAANSPIIVESKSLKLYLNSLNQMHFPTVEALAQLIEQDLQSVTQVKVKVIIKSLNTSDLQVNQMEGVLLDDQQVSIDSYQYSPQLLQLSSADKDDPLSLIKETLVSHLLRSNCLITNQPDWASIQISYTGQPICHQALLAYLVSFRHHNEFHEQCVERIFSDIMQFCRPQKLTVYARYTRRGGLDINPWRSNFENQMPNIRLIRQ